MELTFECTENGRWYVVLPDYEGDQEDLEMVDGADKMLEALTDDGLYVTLTVDIEEPVDTEYFTLEMESHDDCGGFYNVRNCPRFSDMVWLCNVVHFVFGEHPETIYCSVVE